MASKKKIIIIKNTKMVRWGDWFMTFQESTGSHTKSGQMDFVISHCMFSFYPK